MRAQPDSDASADSGTWGTVRHVTEYRDTPDGLRGREVFTVTWDGDEDQQEELGTEAAS